MRKLILVLTLLITGCAGWQKKTANALNATKQGADALHATGAKVLHQICLKQAKKCTVPAAKCKGLQTCQLRRRQWDKSIVALYRSLDVARIAYAAAIADPDSVWKSKAVAMGVKLLAEMKRLAEHGKAIGVLK